MGTMQVKEVVDGQQLSARVLQGTPQDRNSDEGGLVAVKDCQSPRAQHVHHQHGGGPRYEVFWEELATNSREISQPQ